MNGKGLLLENIHPNDEGKSNFYANKWNSTQLIALMNKILFFLLSLITRAAVVHLNFRAGSTFPVPVCTAPHGSWINKEDNQQD